MDKRNEPHFFSCPTDSLVTLLTELFLCVCDVFFFFAPTLGFTMLWPKNHIWRLCGNFG